MFDRTTSARKKLSTHDSVKEPITWAPDSKRLAFTAANRLFVVDVEPAATHRGGAQPGRRLSARGFSPDGNWLVYTRRDDDQNSDVYLFDLAAKKEHNVTANPFNDSRGAITPDGKKLVFLVGPRRRNCPPLRRCRSSA